MSPLAFLFMGAPTGALPRAIEYEPVEGQSGAAVIYVLFRTPARAYRVKYVGRTPFVEPMPVADLCALADTGRVREFGGMVCVEVGV